MNQDESGFKARGVVSLPYEEEAAENRLIHTLRAENNHLRYKNQRLQCLLQLEKRNIDQLFDIMYMVSDFVNCKADRKKLHQTVTHMEQRMFRRDYRNFNESFDDLDLLYSRGRHFSRTQTPDMVDFGGYDYEMCQR